MDTADYLIVGGGTAGCVLASRLKQKLPDANVTVLEAGTDEHKNPMITEMMSTFQLAYTNYQYKYMTAPQKSYEGRPVFNTGGRVLSGSSSVNYGLWSRGSRDDYDLWSKAVNDKRWSYDGLLPYFKKTETYHDYDNVDTSLHGSSGPIHTVSSTKREYPLGKVVTESFLSSTGLPFNKDANAGNPVGIAHYTENWREGKRQPSGFAYGLKGVNVITEALVKRIVVEDGVAVGAELADGRVIKAKKEVILSCGALRSPQVLMLSGIGPKEELAKHGISQVVSNDAAENVGKNFSDHISVPMFYQVKYPEQNVAVGAPGWGAPEYLLGMPVNMILTANQSNAATKAAMIKDGMKDVSDDHPYLGPNRGHSEIIPLYAPTEPPGSNLGLPFDGSVITCGILTLLPTSRGSVTLASADPKADPVIDPNYFATEVDKVLTRAAMRMCIKAFETVPLADQIDSHVPPPGQGKLSTKSTDDELDAYVKRVATTWFHPSGTCAMGKVVDAECRFIGVKNLRVVDASIFPAPLAAHYQAPTYAVAEQAADMIVG